MNPQTATIEECRDFVAGAQGWTQTTDGIWCSPECKDRDDFAACVRSGVLPCLNHPVPATIDAAAKALPEGWTWLKHEDIHNGVVTVVWKAYNIETFAVVPSTGDEILDRFRLAVAAIIAGGSHDTGQ